MSLLVAWLAFPLLLAALAYGCGLLVERLSGEGLPAAIVAGVGLALVIVVARLLTALDATAELAAPVVALLALVGVVVTRGPGKRPPTRWELLVVLVAFTVFALPMLVAGEATLAGYRKLEDGATWLALTNHVLEYGTSIPANLETSAYVRVVEARIVTAYPFGSFLPFGIGGQLLGHETAWLFQPYIAFLAAFLAATIYALAGSVIASPARRALVAVVSSQAALFFGYAMWGGVKEIAAAWLVALAAATATHAVRRGTGARGVLPLAVTAGAAIACLGMGAVAWLGVPLLAAVVVLATQSGWRDAAARAAAFTILCIPLVLLTLAYGDVTQEAGGVLTSQGELGTLVQPTSPLQLGGVWLGGDFRFAPEYPAATLALILTVAAGALAGLWLLVSSRAMAPLLYVAGAGAGCAAVAALGAPWIDSKAFAIASPVGVLLALSAGAASIEDGRRLAGGLLMAVVATGVLASTALALGQVTLAPRDRLEELSEIDRRFDGQGPALVVHREPYATRYLLRHIDADDLIEARLAADRAHEIRLRNGARIEHDAFADVDDLHPGSFEDFRLVVTRRSPLGSRPPGNFRLDWRGRWYDVWRRAAPAPLEHLALNDPDAPTAAPSCAALREFAHRHRGSRLVAAAARKATVVPISGSRLPAGWEESKGVPGAAVPDRPGTFTAELVLPRDDTYEIALGGTVEGRVELAVDGRMIATARHRINHTPGFEPLARPWLAAGRHRLRLDFEDGLLLGRAGRQFHVGPLAIAPAGRHTAMRTVRPRDYRSLCGRRLDWVEAIGPEAAKRFAAASDARGGAGVAPRG